MKVKKIQDTPIPRMEWSNKMSKRVQITKEVEGV